MTDARERRLDALCEATGEATKSKAIDAAIDTYLRLAGNSDAYPTGHLQDLLAAIDDNGGSLDGESIAEHLDTPHLPVAYEETTTWAAGTNQVPEVDK